MKRYLLSLMFFTVMTQAQIVNIPDANFKAKLLTSAPNNNIAYDVNDQAIKIDANNNGQIEIAEAAVVRYLNVNGAAISSLDGIASFTSLYYLNANDNNITSMAPLNGMTSLIGIGLSGNLIVNAVFTGPATMGDVNLSNNPLTSLSFSGITSMNVLNVSNTPIATLSLPGFEYFEAITCSNTQLASIDLSGIAQVGSLEANNNILLTEIIPSPNMFSIWTSGNPLLTELDVTGCPTLYSLTCANNALTSLTLTGMTELSNINISDNPLVYVDFSGAPNLSGINAQATLLESVDLNANAKICLANFSYNPNLVYVLMKNGPPVCGETNDFSNNPALTYFCTDEAEVLEMINYFGSSGMNVNVNTYCSFEPAEGTYSMISGQVRYDLAGDGCDVNDQIPSPVMMTLSDGTNQYAAATSTDGDYVFYVPAGTFTVTPNLENMPYFTVNPANYPVALPVVGTNIPSLDFCITPDGVHQDIEVVISPVTPARPGFDAVYQIVYRNKGNTVVSQEYGLSFFYNHNLMSFVSSDVAPTQAGLGSLNWSYADLMPFEVRSIVVTLHVNAPTDPENPVNINDVLTFNGNISPVGTDVNAFDNNFVLDQVVVGSYDPNDIACLEGAVENPVQIGNYLHYLIRFENTGTYMAENIVVREVIDPAKFDIQSLQFLMASHDVDVRITGDVLEFIFNGINLDTGGHGNILFKMKTDGTLQAGDSVTQEAGIYFDYNFPVETNEANTTFEELSTGQPTDVTVSVYPNPTADRMTIAAGSEMQSLELFDIQGRLLESHAVSGREATLDLSIRASGTYFARIRTANGVSVQRLIRK